MARNKRPKKAAIERPSRLLNLNKSPRAQKLIYVHFPEDLISVDATNTILQCESKCRYIAVALVAT
jgi:hypothetical protein